MLKGIYLAQYLLQINICIFFPPIPVTQRFLNHPSIFLLLSLQQAFELFGQRVWLHREPVQSGLLQPAHWKSYRIISKHTSRIQYSFLHPMKPKGQTGLGMQFIYHQDSAVTQSGTQPFYQYLTTARSPLKRSKEEPNRNHRNALGRLHFLPWNWNLVRARTISCGPIKENEQGIASPSHWWCPWSTHSPSEQLWPGTSSYQPWEGEEVKTTEESCVVLEFNGAQISPHSYSDVQRKMVQWVEVHFRKGPTS